jgi:hypothetical protein
VNWFSLGGKRHLRVPFVVSAKEVRVRTYLAIDVSELVLHCAYCDVTKTLKELYNEPSVPARATGISSVNTHRLVEFIGRFNMEHAECREPTDDEEQIDATVI